MPIAASASPAGQPQRAAAVGPEPEQRLDEGRRRGHRQHQCAGGRVVQVELGDEERIRAGIEPDAKSTAPWPTESLPSAGRSMSVVTASGYRRPWGVAVVPFVTGVVASHRSSRRRRLSAHPGGSRSGSVGDGARSESIDPGTRVNGMLVVQGLAQGPRCTLRVLLRPERGYVRAA